MSEPENVAQPTSTAKLTAEAIGTLLIVLFGVGCAVFARHTFTDSIAAGTLYAATAIAFGSALVVAMYAFGPISGGHFNPAVTLGLAAAGRFPWRGVWGYVVAQVVGGAIAVTVIFLLALFGPDGWLKTAQDSGFASNGWDGRSPGGFTMPAAIIAELVLAGLFVTAYLGATHPRRGTPLAGIVVGLAFTAVLLVSIPIDRGSINPARSIASALYGGSDALVQLWVFVAVPLVAGLLAGVSYRALFDTERD